MNATRLFASFLSLIVGLPLAVAQNNASFLPGGRIIEAKHHHLGDDKTPDWKEASPDPEGTRLDVTFEAQANAKEVVLAIKQRDVTDKWTLQLNGKDIAELKRNKDSAVFYYRLPPGTLADGQNVLSVVPANPKDDMVVGPVHLYSQTFRELHRLRPAIVSVTDAATGKPVPARVTITDLNEKPVEIFDAESTHTAVRRGTLYTLGTETNLELPEGDYLFFATRGPEWSRDSQKLSVKQDEPARAQLRIRREVDTTGFIAADTHIHTLTFSGHGDSSVEERMVTLAGEGVELAISTDHNHNTDYRPYQEKLELNHFFTPVTGNEVTTSVGHMNAFPLDPKDRPPDHKLTDWVQLVEGIRAKGAKVVILNHPRWPNLATCPFTKYGLNRASGDFADGRRFPFDAMELANALTPQPDPLYLFRDWFALLNRGHKITAIASSDSHTVGDPVGQGRSYVPSATDDPAKIDLDDACKRFVAGETTISLGIFADVVVDGRYKMGQTFAPRTRAVDVRLRVAAPGWIKPRRALVFLNGQTVAEKPVPESGTGQPTDVRLDFAVPAPRHDAYLVCVALGDGVNHHCWRTDENFTLAATNPVFLDGDRDGRYSSPRETAQKLLARAGGRPDRQWESVMKADDVIAVQMVSLMREAASPEARAALDKRIREAAAQKPLLAEYAQYALPEEKAASGDGR